MRLSLGDWVAWWADNAPARPAIVFDGAETTTYAQFNAQINRLAGAFVRAGVGRGDRVAVLLNNRPEYLVALFAAAKLGAALVPLNVRLVAGELTHIVRNAEPRLLVSEQAFRPLLEELQQGGADLAGLVRASVLVDGEDERGLERFWENIGAQPPRTEVRLEDPLAICYTSGTTGLPKGAVLTHANVLWTTLQEIVPFAMTPDARHLIGLPLCFTGGLITAAMPVFHTGATLYLERGFEPGTILERVQRERITHVMAVPVMFAALAQEPAFAQADLSSLRLCLVGGAPVPPALVRRYYERGMTVFTNAYGLTEGCGFNMLLPAAEVADHPGAYRPALYTRARVVTAEGTVARAGEEGELLLRGPTIMRGYWRDEAATAEALADGWLHTGDVVRVGEDGCLYPVDRIKDMVVSGGLNVYPAEVEHVLIEHPAVAEVAVIGLPEERWGEAVTAVVVPRAGGSVSADELIEFCRGRLADYKRPKDVIVVERLPRNPSGKVLKRDLRARFAAHYRSVGDRPSSQAGLSAQAPAAEPRA